MKPARTRSNVLKAQVKVRGLQTIDRRTVAAEGLLEWKGELVRTCLYIDHADAYLREQESLVNARKRSLIPLLRERHWSERRNL